MKGYLQPGKSRALSHAPLNEVNQALIAWSL